MLLARANRIAYCFDAQWHMDVPLSGETVGRLIDTDSKHEQHSDYPDQLNGDKPTELRKS